MHLELIIISPWCENSKMSLSVHSFHSAVSLPHLRCRVLLLNCSLQSYLPYTWISDSFEPSVLHFSAQTTYFLQNCLSVTPSKILHQKWSEDVWSSTRMWVGLLVLRISFSVIRENLVPTKSCTFYSQWQHSHSPQWVQNWAVRKEHKGTLIKFVHVYKLWDVNITEDWEVKLKYWKKITHDTSWKHKCTCAKGRIIKMTHSIGDVESSTAKRGH